MCEERCWRWRWRWRWRPAVAGYCARSPYCARSFAFCVRFARLWARLSSLNAGRPLLVSARTARTTGMAQDSTPADTVRPITKLTHNVVSPSWIAVYLRGNLGLRTTILIL